jgi:hypothetical protein
MKLITLKKCWCLVIVFPMILVAKDIEVVVIGVGFGGAPSFEDAFDKRLREDLSTTPEVYTTDYLQTQSYRRKIHFDNYPTVSRKLVESLRQYCSDSTIFVWGKIKNYSIKSVRRYLIRSAIRGEMTFTLTMYSLRYKDYAFSGDVQCSFEKPEGLVFFGPVDEEVHISGSKRAEITEQLVDLATQKSANMIMAVIRSEGLRAARESNSGGLEAYQIPSVQDVFSVPSVEGASVNKNRKKASVPSSADSANKATLGQTVPKSNNASVPPASGRKK